MYICDLHNDFFTQGISYNTIKQDFENNCKHVVFALFKGSRQDGYMLKLANSLSKLAQKDKRFMLGFEDIGEYSCDINTFLQYNPSYVSLTWNGENKLGYGCNINKPLKKAGLKIIDILNKSNVCLDTAHLSQKGFYQAIEKANRVINSHTCLNGVHKHMRNLTDEQVKLIIQKQGIIGLALVGEFLTLEKPNIHSIMSHIVYYFNKFGDTNLCLGTDFFGTSNLPFGISNYNSLHSLVDMLLASGCPQTSIENIFYKNFINYFKAKD